MIVCQKKTLFTASESALRLRAQLYYNNVCSDKRLLAYNDVSGNFYYNNPKEGVQGFPVVPNKSAMR